MDIGLITVCVIILAVILALWGLGLVNLDNLRQWLLYAVTQAEAELGGGTGQIKLRLVYDMAVSRFGWLVKIIPFSLFSQLVDEALVKMRELLQTNTAVAAIVSGEEADNG